MKKLLLLPLLVLSLSAAEITLTLSPEQVAALDAVVVRMNAEAIANTPEGEKAPRAITVAEYAVLLAFAQINAVTRDEARRATVQITETITALETADRELVVRVAEADAETKERVRTELDSTSTETITR